MFFLEQWKEFKKTRPENGSHKDLAESYPPAAGWRKALMGHLIQFVTHHLDMRNVLEMLRISRDEGNSPDAGARGNPQIRIIRSLSSLCHFHPKFAIPVHRLLIESLEQKPAVEWSQVG
jgi:hypothetical protein